LLSSTRDIQIESDGPAIVRIHLGPGQVLAVHRLYISRHLLLAVNELPDLPPIGHN